jgi:hypothetical protein
MTKEEVRRICEERMKRWAKIMIEEHSTPFCALAIGHDHKSGQLHVCVPDDVPFEDVALLLEKALALLRNGGEVEFR